MKSRRRPRGGGPAPVTGTLLISNGIYATFAAMEDDRALLQRWREGDGRAGEELFRRHFADLFRFFDSKVGARAEDLARQTFVACVKSRDDLGGEPSFRS